MKTIHYEIELLSDGEMGSGKGGETVNAILARDHNDQPVIRSSHLKGLLREAIGQLVSVRKWPTTLGELTLGRPGKEGDSGFPGLAKIHDVCLPAGQEVKVHPITRTSVGDLGVAVNMTLRTTEAIAMGSLFKGTVDIEDGAPPIVFLVLSLALMSFEAVGGNRNRGSGACLVRILNETRSPGELLKLIDAECKKDLPKAIHQPLGTPACKEMEGPPVTFKLSFEATDPVAVRRHRM